MKKPSRPFKEDLKNSRTFLAYTNIAVKMILIILAGVYSGIKLDAYFEVKSSIFTLVMSIVSVAAAMYIIIREFTSK